MVVEISILSGVEGCEIGLYISEYPRAFEVVDGKSRVVSVFPKLLTLSGQKYKCNRWRGPDGRIFELSIILEVKS